MKFLAKCIWSPISQSSVDAAICSAHVTPLNCLEWIPVLVSSRQNWPKKEPRASCFYKASTEFFTLLVVCNSGSMDSGQGKEAPLRCIMGCHTLQCTSIMPGPWPCAANKQATLSSLPTNKLWFRITKKTKNTPMWESSLSQASFHSFPKVILNCRWQGWKAVAFHGARRERSGRERASFQKFTILYLFSPSGIKDLWSWGKTDNNNKKKN